MHSTQPHSKSITLLKLIGIPGILEPTIHVNEEDVQSFLAVAEQNKIPLIFLEKVAGNVTNLQIHENLSHYREKCKNFLDLIAFTANSLEKVKARYTFFKTLKPFSCTPSDVDVLLWSADELEVVVKFLNKNGCVSLDKSPYGRTMFSPKHKLNIDLTTQVSTSGLVYMDKLSLFKHVGRFNIHGTNVQSLKPEADLLAVAAHSIFKEQLYTLGDYYTFVMLTQHWKKAAELSTCFHLKQALNTVLRMTISLTILAFNKLIPFSKELDELSIVNISGSIANDCELPRKYDLATLSKAFLRKIKDDPAATKSLSYMARFVANPEVYKKIVEHWTRKTY